VSEPADIRLFRRIACDALSGPAADLGAAAWSGSAAIICLTRGYDDLGGYDALIIRNKSIFDRINRFRARPYPLLIFHEGNIPDKHQQHVLTFERNSIVLFVDVSSLFRASAFVDHATFAETWSLGYRLMCRFHTLHVWQCCRDFEYILRLDEDCVLESVEQDPVDWTRENDHDFVTAQFVGEAHELTNQSLPAFVTRYRAAMGETEGASQPYDQLFPYTNFYVTRMSFWRRRDVQRFLCAATREPDALRKRWGDLPLLGLALKMYCGQVAEIPGIIYRHSGQAVGFR
jgi:hypothetical protein